MICITGTMFNLRTTFFVGLLAFAAAVPVSAQAAQLAVAWSDNSIEEDGFLVERRGPTGPFAQIAAVGANAVAYLDSGVVTGSNYCYRVRAFNASGMSAYTNEACGAANRTATVPLSVSLNKATFTANETLLSTVTAVGGLISTPIDAYVVMEAGGVLLSLQLDGRLVPGLVPIARGIVLSSVSVPFGLPLAGAPPGAYQWLAAVTSPGTLTLVSPIASTPFTIVP